MSVSWSVIWVILLESVNLLNLVLLKLNWVNAKSTKQEEYYELSDPNRNERILIRMINTSCRIIILFIIIMTLFSSYS